MISREPHPLVTYIFDTFKKNANPDYAGAMKSYMKSQIPFYGIQSGPRKKLYTEAFRKYPVSNLDEYLSIAEQLWDGIYREDKYTAIAFLRKYHKYHTMDLLPLIKKMIETGAWWDFVDEISAHLTGALLKNHPDEMKKILFEWIKNENIWIRRSAILSQLRFKKETDEEMLFDFCQRRLHEKEFWTRKAIGWALREYSKSNAAAVRDFVIKHKDNMSALTLKEASKYI